MYIIGRAGASPPSRTTGPRLSVYIYMYIYVYCMKPPNIKAPKCTLFSIQYFIIQGQRSQALAGLATAHGEHRWGQLTLESPFRIVESG